MHLESVSFVAYLANSGFEYNQDYQNQNKYFLLQSVSSCLPLDVFCVVVVSLFYSPFLRQTKRCDNIINN